MRTPRPHRVLIRYGYLPRRIEPCSYPNCVVENGISSCGELACDECGAGPVELIGHKTGWVWCDACGTYKSMQY